jgi:hypothetical protein
MAGTLHEDQHTFFIISPSIILRMKNVSDTSCTENRNTHVMFNNFFSKIVPFMRYCEKISQCGASHVTIWRMGFAWWIPKFTNTHSGFVILIFFPLQQWLHERASMLHYTYIACLVKNCCFLHTVWLAYYLQINEHTWRWLPNVAKQLRLLHYISSYNIQMHGKIKLTDVVNR